MSPRLAIRLFLVAAVLSGALAIAACSSASGLEADRAGGVAAPDAVEPADVPNHADVAALGDSGSLGTASVISDAQGSTGGATAGSTGTDGGGDGEIGTTGGVLGHSLCPASGPFGTGVGATIADGVLKDCDGNNVSISALCQYKAAWLYSFAPW